MNEVLFTKELFSTLLSSNAILAQITFWCYSLNFDLMLAVLDTVTVSGLKESVICITDKILLFVEHNLIKFTLVNVQFLLL